MWWAFAKIERGCCSLSKMKIFYVRIFEGGFVFRVGQLLPSTVKFYCWNKTSGKQEEAEMESAVWLPPVKAVISPF
jgi:hypothetical protein